MLVRCAGDVVVTRQTRATGLGGFAAGWLSSWAQGLAFNEGHLSDDSVDGTVQLQRRGAIRSALLGAGALRA